MHASDETLELSVPFVLDNLHEGVQGGRVTTLSSLANLNLDTRLDDCECVV
jgi:hypothetical protein